jgi:hypothetical protein
MKTLTILVFGVTAWAGPIISNLAQPPNGLNSISGGTVVAVGFTMNAGPAFNLTDAMFTLFNGVNGPNGTPVPGSVLNVGLFADSGGVPTGSALVTLTVPGTIGTGGGTYTATPNSAFQLLPSTSYWLILNDPNSNDTLAWGATNFAATGSLATDKGIAGGTMTSPTQVLGFTAQAGHLFYEIDATVAVTTAAPEPGTLLLMAGALAAVVSRRRR